MDDLDRLYRRLVHNIRANRPEYLQIPFTVRDLFEQIIPYRHNRRELAIDSNDDYEVAVARLLSGERGYLQGDPQLQEDLRKELASPTGDPGVFKDHGASTVSLTPVATDARTPVAASPAAGMKTPVTHAESPSTSPSASPDPSPQPQTPQTPSQATSAASPASPAPSAPPAPQETQVPSLLSSLSNIDVPMGCRFCGGTLPEGREANYCPHCGENLRTKRCPACGAEVDTNWGYCVTCGRKAG